MARLFQIIFGAVLVLFATLVPLGGAEADEAIESSASTNQVATFKPAKLSLSGYGFLGNRELKKLVYSLDTRAKNREFHDANFVEDAVLILIARLKRDGFLKPEIQVDLVLDTNEKKSFRWREELDPPLQRPLKARSVEFTIREGIRYRFDDVSVTGVTAISEAAAENFFVEKGVLIPLKRTRIYSPQKLRRGISSLEEILERQGYRQVRVVSTNLTVNDEDGRADVAVVVEEGPRWFVRGVQVSTVGATNVGTNVINIQTNVPFSQLWLQDFAQSLRNSNYHRGFPDTEVGISIASEERTNDVVNVMLAAKVRSGDQFWIGKVRFEGQERTRLPLMRRRSRVYAGELLDRVAVEKGQHRLARLGIFNSVQVAYDQPEPGVREVIYKVDESKTIDVSLLAGYGSYELLRGGIELEQFNVFGRGHNSRLRLVQSMRSSVADYVYTMPELVGEDVDVFLNASGLRREEVTFTRQEFGGGFGARTYFDNISSLFGARYSYQILDATETDVEIGPREAAVSAIILDLRHDQRDSPLSPRSGYKVFTTLEMASEFLGGEVDFARFETAASFHQPLDPGRWLHLGISHGVVYALDTPAVDIPFNRRFFPGGENSIRGYQQGEAAPRDNFGRVLGAETFLAGNFEFEQALTDTWSLVAFFDVLSFGKDVSDYPGNELVYSVGGGLRWRTIIGPVRVEYGHNLNRRTYDPAGTLHFSIGFPF